MRWALPFAALGLLVAYGAWLYLAALAHAFGSTQPLVDPLGAWRLLLVGLGYTLFVGVALVVDRAPFHALAVVGLLGLPLLTEGLGAAMASQERARRADDAAAREAAAREAMAVFAPLGQHAGEHGATWFLIVDDGRLLEVEVMSRVMTVLVAGRVRGDRWVLWDRGETAEGPVGERIARYHGPDGAPLDASWRIVPLPEGEPPYDHALADAIEARHREAMR